MDPNSPGLDDYIDEDVAYLLGMLFGRGQLIEDGELRRLVITLNIQRTTPKLPPGVSLEMDLDRENERSLNIVRSRINTLLDANVDITPVREGMATLTAIFSKRTIGWRDLRFLCSNGNDRSNFLLPEAFFRLPKPLHEEFLRGFADVAVTPSFADRDQAKRVRIAFPVVNANRRFARQLVTVFEGLNVRPYLLAGSAGKRGGTKREHRIRPYAEKYRAIGFGFAHKQRLLELLAEYNERLHGNAS